MNGDYLTLCPHVMKLCGLTQKIYSMDARRTKISLNSSPSQITPPPFYPMNKNGKEYEHTY